MAALVGWMSNAINGTEDTVVPMPTHMGQVTGTTGNNKFGSPIVQTSPYSPYATTVSVPIVYKEQVNVVHSPSVVATPKQQSPLTAPGSASRVTTATQTPTQTTTSIKPIPERALYGLDCCLTDRVIATAKECFIYQHSSVLAFSVNPTLLSTVKYRGLTPVEISTLITLFAHTKARFESRQAYFTQLAATSLSTSSALDSSRRHFLGNVFGAVLNYAPDVLSVLNIKPLNKPASPTQETLDSVLNPLEGARDNQVVWNFIVDKYVEEVQVCSFLLDDEEDDDEEGEEAFPSEAKSTPTQSHQPNYTEPSDMESGKADTSSNSNNSKTKKDSFSYFKSEETDPDEDYEDGLSLIQDDFIAISDRVERALRRYLRCQIPDEADKKQLLKINSHFFELGKWNGTALTTFEKEFYTLEELTPESLPIEEKRYVAQNLPAWIELGKMPVSGRLRVRNLSPLHAAATKFGKPEVVAFDQETGELTCSERVMNFVLLVMHEFSFSQSRQYYRLYSADINMKNDYHRPQKLTDGGMTLVGNRDKHIKRTFSTMSLQMDQKLIERCLWTTHARIKYLKKSLSMAALHDQNEFMQNVVTGEFLKRHADSNPANTPPIILPFRESADGTKTRNELLTLGQAINNQYLSSLDRFILSKVASFYTQSNNASAQMNTLLLELTDSYHVKQPNVHIRLMGRDVGVSGDGGNGIKVNSSAQNSVHPEATYLARHYPTLFFKLLYYVCLPYFELYIEDVEQRRDDGSGTSREPATTHYFTDISPVTGNNTTITATNIQVPQTVNLRQQLPQLPTISSGNEVEGVAVWADVSRQVTNPTHGKKFLVTNYKNGTKTLVLGIDTNPLATEAASRWHIC